MASNKGAELLESLKKQGLSQQEMLNRLDAIVDAESAQPEGKRDRELIQACIDLQWFLTTGENYTARRRWQGKNWIRRCISAKNKRRMDTGILPRRRRRYFALSLRQLCCRWLARRC